MCKGVKSIKDNITIEHLSLIDIDFIDVGSEYYKKLLNMPNLKTITISADLLTADEIDYFKKNSQSTCQIVLENNVL